MIPSTAFPARNRLRDRYGLMPPLSVVGVVLLFMWWRVTVIVLSSAAIPPWNLPESSSFSSHSNHRVSSPPVNSSPSSPSGYSFIQNTHTHPPSSCARLSKNIDHMQLQGREKEDSLIPNFIFSEVHYLQAKRSVDARAMSRQVWAALQHELASVVRQHKLTLLNIVEVGAGTLSMLQLWFSSFPLTPETEEIASDYPLHSVATSDMDTMGCCSQLTAALTLPPTVTQVRYDAFEPNQRLQQACYDQLIQLGFQREGSTSNDSDVDQEEGSVWVKQHQHVYWTVYVHFRPFENQFHCTPPSHLIIGCCFADLIPPQQLLHTLCSQFCSHPANFNSTLLYFPITFSGLAQFVPAQPLQIQTVFNCTNNSHNNNNNNNNNQLQNQQPKQVVIPSDTTALRLYANELEYTHGHHLHPEALIETVVADFGGTCIRHQSSDWWIDPVTHPYLWDTLLYFFETVLIGPPSSPLVQRSKQQTTGYCPQTSSTYSPSTYPWDLRRWLQRARQRKPLIHVSNVDLLFRIPRQGSWTLPMRHHHPAARLNDVLDTITTTMTQEHRITREIQFIAPRAVSTVTRSDSKELMPQQVRIQAVASLISSGTELKIFKGEFEDNPETALDLTIDGMRDQSMSYPLTYGYSYVGRVVECGSHISNRPEDLIGKLVFCFAPHSTFAIVDETSIHVIPDGIDPLDAIFMPAMETALSLIHEANPRVGERVAIFGQGLIGLLTTAILSQTMPANLLLGSSHHDLLTTIDTNPLRLAVSARMGAMQALFPREAVFAAPFDVVIEVSGNKEALQSAIDLTREGGLIIVGSWYGSTNVTLRLGMEFHRSHKVIRASQVSKIPAELSSIWTKSRRFAVTWDLVRALRPSHFLIPRVVSLDDAQDAFEALEQGTDNAIVFDYSL